MSSAKETIRMPVKDAGRISVDVNRFGHGMEMTLAGMSEVWGSLGLATPSDWQAVPPEEQKTEPKKAAKSVEHKGPSTPETVKEPQASGISLENVTSAIVAKLKQDKGNNDAIQKILAGYNVSKVSELKPEQYEAFMADLARL